MPFRSDLCTIKPWTANQHIIPHFGQGFNDAVAHSLLLTRGSKPIGDVPAGEWRAPPSPPFSCGHIGEAPLFLLLPLIHPRAAPGGNTKSLKFKHLPSIPTRPEQNQPHSLALPEVLRARVGGSATAVGKLPHLRESHVLYDLIVLGASTAALCSKIYPIPSCSKFPFFPLVPESRSHPSIISRSK